MSSPSPAPQSQFQRLIEIMQRLRDPSSGCPWDLEQSFETIAPYTIEEAYEVSDAIDRKDYDDLRDELGDLLLQVVFHSQIASESGLFAIDDVARAINDKMVRRHPHVFGDAEERDANTQTAAWEQIKADERAEKTGKETVSALDGIAIALPALLRAEKLQKRAARTGFDWVDPKDILDKLAEETGEIHAAIETGKLNDIEDEIGDLLFVGANLARRFGLDPEIALKKANAKFERRFRAMEALATGNGEAFDELGLSEQETLWNTVKLQQG